MPIAKILFVLAYEGYHHIEYGIPKKVIEAAGLSSAVASNKAGSAIGKDGSTTPIDILIKNVNPANYAGVFFIGGPGALENLDNQESYTLIQKTLAAKIPLGAICISPRILAKAGALQGRTATGWDEDGQLDTIFNEYGVALAKQNVVIDGTIITATGPRAAQEFGDGIVKLIKAR